MSDDGTMARVPELIPFCERHGLKMVTVADLIAYRRRHEKLVERVVETRMPTKYGEFNVLGYRSMVDGSTTWRWSRARSTARTTCSCACTPSA